MKIAPAQIQVRFSDCDMMGHVNNAIYLSYFEMARIHYFRQLLGDNWDWRANGVLLRKNEVEYLLPVLLHEKPDLYVRTLEIGTKSFTLSYELRVGDELRTVGKSVLVCFDQNAHQSIPLSDEWKNALEQLKNNHL
jgi:acyl-CoA thioester hydrolase